MIGNLQVFAFKFDRAGGFYDIRMIFFVTDVRSSAVNCTKYIPRGRCPTSIVPAMRLERTFRPSMSCISMSLPDKGIVGYNQRSIKHCKPVGVEVAVRLYVGELDRTLGCSVGRKNMRPDISCREIHFAVELDRVHSAERDGKSVAAVGFIIRILEEVCLRQGTKRCAKETEGQVESLHGDQGYRPLQFRAINDRKVAGIPSEFRVPLRPACRQAGFKNH